MHSEVVGFLKAAASPSRPHLPSAPSALRSHLTPTSRPPIVLSQLSKRADPELPIGKPLRHSVHTLGPDATLPIPSLKRAKTEFSEPAGKAAAAEGRKEGRKKGGREEGRKGGWEEGRKGGREGPARQSGGASHTTSPDQIAPCPSTAPPPRHRQGLITMPKPRSHSRNPAPGQPRGQLPLRSSERGAGRAAGKGWRGL